MRELHLRAQVLIEHGLESLVVEMVVLDVQMPSCLAEVGTLTLVWLGHPVLILLAALSTPAQELVVQVQAVVMVLELMIFEFVIVQALLVADFA